MAKIAKFKINGLPSALSNQFVRITDTNRQGIIEGNLLTTDSQGNATVNLQGAGTAGQGIIINGDDFISSGPDNFKGFTGYSVILDTALNQFSRYTFVYGQSLSVGDGGEPNVRNTPELSNVPNMMLLSGVDTNGPGGSGKQYSGSELTSTKAYAEYDTKQSHGWGYANYLKSKGDTNESIYTSIGVGARSVSDLSSAPESTNINPVITAASSFLTNTVKKGNIQWIQGEKDTTDGTAPSVWKVDTKTLLESIKAKMLTEGVSDTETYLVQLSKGNTHPSGGYSIADAQLEIVLENDNYHLAVAPWFINRKYGRIDYQPHFTSNGYDLMGEYLAKAELSVADGKSKFVPPYPVSFNVLPDYRTIEIIYGGEIDGLVVGATATETDIPLADGAGFGIGELTNTDIILPTTSQALAGNKLTLVSPVLLEVGTELTAGRTGPNWSKATAYKLPCINLRNTSTEISPSTGDTMHDWASQFTEALNHTQGAFDRDIDNLWDENIDPAFTLPAASAAASSNSSYTGIVTYTMMQPNATYLCVFTLTINSGSIRITFGSSSDGLRETFTESGTYTRTVSTVSGRALKADALGNDHDVSIDTMSVTRTA